jgi:hypothetical protein
MWKILEKLVYEFLKFLFRVVNFFILLSTFVRRFLTVRSDAKILALVFFAMALCFSMRPLRTF